MSIVDEKSFEFGAIDSYDSICLLTEIFRIRRPTSRLQDRSEAHRDGSEAVNHISTEV